MVIFFKNFKNFIFKIILFFKSNCKKIPFNNKTTALFEKNFKTKWFLDIEIFIKYALLYRKEMKIWEEPLMYWEEIPGSKIN